MIHQLAFWLVLALSVPCYWLTPPRYRLGLLAGISFTYLVTLEPVSVAVLSGWALLFHYGATSSSVAAAPYRRPLLLGAAILTYLAAFKYVPPLAAALVAGTAAYPVLIPLGISYYTFKLYHYAIEVARGTIRDRSLSSFLAYLFLFPTFSAGPIERFDHFTSNLEGRWHSRTAIEGVTRIVVGLGKKLVVADLILIWFLREVTPAEAVARLPFWESWKAWAYFVLAYLRLYMDFAGYSDIAIGASRLFGIRIMENFNWPILACNIGEFWRRWHMTLAGWCQSYVYMPVLGVTRNPWVAGYVTFAVMGLWHAGSLQWLAWGLYHATGVAVFRLWQRTQRRLGWEPRPGLPGRLLGVLVTQLFVAGGGVFSGLYGVAGLRESLYALGKLLFADLPVPT